MKISYKHLVKNIHTNPSIEKLSEKLFQLGHEHEISGEIFDMELTPNRGDCFSLNGLLRDLSIFYDISFEKEIYEKDIPNFSFKFKNDSDELNVLNENIVASNFAPIDSFFEIAPIDYEMDNSSRKELSSVPLSEVDFPKVVYMIVDKKIELEIKLLKDFPEWEFLPHDDLNRKTIEIFFDINLAKRSCNKEQKVIKVPNTDVFRIATPILIEKGISRIVCAENLIAL